MHNETVLGPVIVSHLDAWLDRQLPTFEDDLLAKVRAAMLAAAVEDDAWLDRGWWKTFDHVMAEALETHDENGGTTGVPLLGRYR